MANVVRYSDEEKARVKVALEANRHPDGTFNVKRTSIETGVSRGTIATWIRKWELEGPSAETQEALPAIREKLVGELERIRDKALDALDTRLDLFKTDPSSLLKVNPKDLATTAAILTDKARLVEGKATSRSEGSSEGNLPIDQVRELFAGFAKGLVEGARERDAAISSVIDGEEPIEVEFTEQAEPLALRP